jgi:hypothetical protein
MGDFFEQVMRVRGGHVALALCALFYLVWWFVFFRPNAQAPTGALRVFGLVCIGLAVLCGIVGVVRIARVASVLPTYVSNWTIVALGVVVYIVVLLVTRFAFDRPVTTELVLIVAWTVLELCVANALIGSGAVRGGVGVAVVAITLIAFALSLVCYTMYYRLSPGAAFLDGCAPLAFIALVSVVFSVIIR